MTVVFVDESGFHLLTGRVATYALCAQTPVLRWPVTRDHLSVMHVEMRNLCCSNLDELRRQLRLATMRLQAKPHLLRACFAGAGFPLGP